MRRFLLLVFLLSFTAPLFAADNAKLVVYVRNQVGFPITDLKTTDFAVTMDKEPLNVASAAYVNDKISDIILLIDESEVGRQIAGRLVETANYFIDRLADNQQMGIIGYGSSADMLQDLTSSKTALKRAFEHLKFGNPPQLLDAIYAAIDGGFEHSAGRKILMIIGSGMDARDKVTAKEVLALARRNSVSISAMSFGRDWDLEKITEQTAGDYYRGKELKQAQQVVQNITDGFKGHYELELAGAVLDTQGKLKIAVKRDEKLRVSYRVEP